MFLFYSNYTYDLYAQFLNRVPAKPSCLTCLTSCPGAGFNAFEEEREKEAVEKPPATEWRPDDVI